MPDALRIEPTPPEHLCETLLLAFGGLSPENQAARVEMLARQAEEGSLCLEGILRATRRGKLVGAVISQLQAGRSALVWPPVVMPDEPDTTRHSLLQTACQGLASRGAVMASMLFDTQTAVDSSLAQDFGFAPLATIAYLMATRAEFPTTAPDVDFEPEAVMPWHVARWSRILEQTYEETLDCPGLEGMRSTEDVLEGYLAAGVYRPEYWSVLRQAGEDLGCLILVDHPGQNMSELAYMGLARRARGKGLGAQISRWAQWLANTADRDRLLVGVDVANLPAANVYASCGFREWDRKTVFVRRFLPSPSALDEHAG